MGSVSGATGKQLYILQCEFSEYVPLLEYNEFCLINRTDTVLKNIILIQKLEHYVHIISFEQHHYVMRRLPCP